MVERNSDEALSLVFRTLGDPSRRRILQLLREAGELRVSDVAAAFDMSLNGVSKHLKTLEKAGLILRRVAGKTHWLSVDPDGLAPAYDWIHSERQYWTSRLDALAATLTPAGHPDPEET